MKTTSLNEIFITEGPAGSGLDALADADASLSQLRHALTGADFNTAYDFFRSRVRGLNARGEADRARSSIEQTDALLLRAGSESALALDMHAAMIQILTALLIETGKEDEALVTAASALSLLAQQPRRKDEPFLQVLGALLHDIALLHSRRNEYRQAERELEKSLKIFGRLAKVRPARYAAAVIMAQDAATDIYRSRVKQANLLAHYQVATATYLQMVNEGVADATERLVDSLHTEGRTLARMGKTRQAVQYYVRALKYRQKVSDDFDARQLALSTDLGEALLAIPATRDKGVHLLNTMLHKATRIGAADEHRRIVEILLNAKSRRLDILGLWHKVFPR